jgi:hypothetical protein
MWLLDRCAASLALPLEASLAEPWVPATLPPQVSARSRPTLLADISIALATLPLRVTSAHLQEDRGVAKAVIQVRQLGAQSTCPRPGPPNVL